MATHSGCGLSLGMNQRMSGEGLRVALQIASGSCWAGAVGGAIAICTVFSASGALAQVQALPPPPAIPNVDPGVGAAGFPGTNGLQPLAPIPAPQGGQPLMLPALNYPRPNVLNNVPNGNYPQGAYAPPSGYPAMPQQSAQPPIAQPQTAYTVVINGDSPYLLQLVQQIEPIATVQDLNGRRVIQAGVFGSQQEAMQRIAILQQQGVAAQMMPISLGNQNPTGLNSTAVNPMALRSASQFPPQTAPQFAPQTAPQQRTSHFEVVVPTETANFGMVTNRMMSMGVKPEAIQSKQVPLGPHIAVGPFNEINEARSVSAYLRTGGLDARVYYAK
jgi:hypothetical protein